MKKIGILLLLLCGSCMMWAQKVYSVDYDYQADVKVYVVQYEYLAVLLVYEVKYK